MKILIKATKTDIKNGENSGNLWSEADTSVSCPIFFALKRLIAPKFLYSVGTLTISMEDGTKYRLPKTAKENIEKFDNGYPVEPFEFHLNIKQKYLA